MFGSDEGGRGENTKLLLGYPIKVKFKPILKRLTERIGYANFVLPTKGYSF